MPPDSLPLRVGVSLVLLLFRDCGLDLFESAVKLDSCFDPRGLRSRALFKEAWVFLDLLADLLSEQCAVSYLGSAIND